MTHYRVLKQAEARPSILKEFKRWLTLEQLEDTNPLDFDAFLFFRYLQRERPDLLTFRCRGASRWQRICEWLNQAKMI